MQQWARLGKSGRRESGGTKQIAHTGNRTRCKGMGWGLRADTALTENGNQVQTDREGRGGRREAHGRLVVLADRRGVPDDLAYQRLPPRTVQDTHCPVHSYQSRVPLLQPGMNMPQKKQDPEENTAHHIHWHAITNQVASLDVGGRVTPCTSLLPVG